MVSLLIPNSLAIWVFFPPAATRSRSCRILSPFRTERLPLYFPSALAIAMPSRCRSRIHTCHICHKRAVMKGIARFSLNFFACSADRFKGSLKIRHEFEAVSNSLNSD